VSRLVHYNVHILQYTHSCILTHTLSHTCITSERHCCCDRYTHGCTCWYGRTLLHRYTWWWVGTLLCVYTCVWMVHSTHTLRSSYIIIEEGFYPWVGTPGSPPPPWYSQTDFCYPGYPCLSQSEFDFTRLWIHRYCWTGTARWVHIQECPATQGWGRGQSQLEASVSGPTPPHPQTAACR
jgi:hypothetical protein